MERTLYLRSKVQPPSFRNCGSCFSSAAASAATWSSHFRPSARLSAASAGSALIRSSSRTLASTAVVLSAASGLGSAARAGVARHATAASRISLRAKGEAARSTATILCGETVIERALFGRLAMAEPRVELVDQFLGGVGDHGAGREDRLGASLVQCVVIL